MMSDRLLTVLCPNRHQVARVRWFQGRECVEAPVRVPELSPQGPPGAVLEGLRSQWGVWGSLHEFAYDGTTIVAGCDCGSHAITARWILDQLHGNTSRKREVIHAPQVTDGLDGPTTRLPKSLAQIAE